MSHHRSRLVKPPISYFQSECLSKHREALKNSNRRRDTFLINKAELDWSLLLGSFRPAPLLHCLYLISFGLKSHKENEEAEAINHLESLVKAGAIATLGKETEGRVALARAGQGQPRCASERHGDGAGSCGQKPGEPTYFLPRHFTLSLL